MFRSLGTFIMLFTFMLTTAVSGFFPVADAAVSYLGMAVSAERSDDYDSNESSNRSRDRNDVNPDDAERDGSELSKTDSFAKYIVPNPALLDDKSEANLHFYRGASELTSITITPPKKPPRVQAILFV